MKIATFLFLFFYLLQAACLKPFFSSFVYCFPLFPLNPGKTCIINQQYSTATCRYNIYLVLLSLPSSSFGWFHSLFHVFWFFVSPFLASLWLLTWNCHKFRRNLETRKCKCMAEEERRYQRERDVVNGSISGSHCSTTNSIVSPSLLPASLYVKIGVKLYVIYSLKFFHDEKSSVLAFGIFFFYTSTTWTKSRLTDRQTAWRTDGRTCSCRPQSRELLRVLKKGSNPQEGKSDLHEEKKNPQEEKINPQEEKTNLHEEKSYKLIWWSY